MSEQEIFWDVVSINIRSMQRNTMTQQQKDRLQYLQAITTDPDFFRLSQAKRKKLRSELTTLKKLAKAA